MNITRIFSILLVSIVLFSCASKKKEDEKILPAEQIYNESMDKLGQKKYKKAIEGFEELERTYPYSKWAIKAQIMSAYTSYNSEEYTDTIITLDKFISLHPGNKDIAYAYYLKAMCYYEQISDITRDQSYSVAALAALKEVIARFPTSEYARDAQGKLDLILDHLGGKELEIGRFYLKHKKYIAAINRFKEVVNKYQTTSHVPEALHRLVEASLAIGLKDEAQKYASVLGYNYPGSKWYEYSYELIEGKKPDIKTQNNIADELYGFVKNPFKNPKDQPNLVNTIDKNINELGGEDEYTEDGFKRSDLIILIPELKNDRAKVTPKESGILNWFKNLKVPFSGQKDNQEPVLEGK